MCSRITGIGQGNNVANLRVFNGIKVNISVDNIRWVMLNFTPRLKNIAERNQDQMIYARRKIQQGNKRRMFSIPPPPPFNESSRSLYKSNTAIKKFHKR